MFGAETVIADVGVLRNLKIFVATLRLVTIW